MSTLCQLSQIGGETFLFKSLDSIAWISHGLFIDQSQNGSTGGNSQIHLVQLSICARHAISEIQRIHDQSIQMMN